MIRDENLSIAVIGAGVAGLTTAHLLSKKHHVTLFEKNDYLGGHTNTITLSEGNDSGTPIDTGFIVFNQKNYPTFIRLLASLGLEGQKSDMSFSFYSEKDKFTYSSYVPHGLFAQRSNYFRPSFYGMILDVLRFNKRSRKDLHEGKLKNISLGDYLKEGKYKKLFIDKHIIPTGAAIWSTPFEEMFNFPAETFVRFFENHGLLQLEDRPQWMSVPNGSQSYVRKIREQFTGTIQENSEIDYIERDDECVKVKPKSGELQGFDYVVLASHADESLKILKDPTEDEKQLLGAWKYSVNHAVLHSDVAAMPANRRAWASWNYIEEAASDPSEPISLTYWMNNLQALKTSKNYFVTLNRNQPLDPGTIIKEIIYTHPCYTFESVRTQAELPRLNGPRRTFFCGSYFGYGFHEDAVKSAVQVTEQFGINL